MKPLVAIVGRPNVGKSTLFNRLARRRLALVEDVPGVTRDRHYADAEWGDRVFTVIDTGGFIPGENDSLLTEVRAQAQLAIDECDVILFVTDGREGLTPVDTEIARLLRKSGKPIVLAANKVDSAREAERGIQADFFRLGLGDVFPVSAEHGLGSEDLTTRMLELLPEATPDTLEEAIAQNEIRMAIIGRPNAGKSTLVNSLLKEKRLVASDTPGTTRDPIDSALEFEDQRYILTDTAGIRRKKSIAQRIEKFSVIAALKVVEKSEIAVLLLDATEPGVDQDAKLAGLVDERGRALLIVVNKWDKIEKDAKKEAAFRADLKERFKFVAYAPVLFTSALTGLKVQKVLEVGKQLATQFRYRAPTPQLNRLLEHIYDNHPSPIVDGRPLRLYYMAQVAAAPPTFTITCNKPKGVPDRYRRYIVNQLREAFGLRVPIRLLFRERPGQAKRAARKKPELMKKRPKHTDE